MRDVEQRMLRWSSLCVHKVHNRTLVLTEDARVRLGDKIADRCRVPVVPSGHPALVIQTLLDNGPLARRSDHETMEVNLEAIGNRIVIDASGKPAGPDQLIAVETATIGN